MIKDGLLCLLLVATGGASRAEAQEVSDSDPEEAAVMGRIVDADSGSPLDGAFVAFEGRRGGVYTDSTGLFYMRDPKGGAHRITIEMLGYGTSYVLAALVNEAPPVQIPLKADPIVLEGIQVTADRFERRRNAAPTSVRAFGLRQLRTSPTTDMLEFLEVRTGLNPEPCGYSVSARASPGGCAIVRGRLTKVVVCVDEVPMLGDLDMLRSISPGDLEMVEVYGGGRQIRLYSRAFMENASRIRLNPNPVIFGC